MRVGLGLLQAFIGLGAVGGGFMLLWDPSGATMGIPISLLEGSIFPNFLIPGIFLFTVNGLGSLAGAYLTFTRNRWAGPVATALGLILMTWIVIQVSIFRGYNWMHILYFILGMLEALLGVRLARGIPEGLRTAHS